MERADETTDATREAEDVDATQAHAADRPPTEEEEAAAEESREKYGADAKDVAAHYEEMSDIGAHVKGEGAID
jgi:parvulin-like peptidyl-prolyl isomerase